ncbi:hypothetical protein BC793_104411 [Actinoplanes xinjiangensis]|uniref:Uncharacterized protein n=1 Tax=Actinoplanes xinjiangensis TaxID=512350 RepID=A0A316FPW3_9ACTN|nr:hypothetical protein BC793_104411 [Actinoplanes xinjiangensis]
MVAISGDCAASMVAASSFTRGSAARSPARADITTACWWWTLMCSANATSASLNTALGEAEVVISALEWPVE